MTQHEKERLTQLLDSTLSCAKWTLAYRDHVKVPDGHPTREALMGTIAELESALQHMTEKESS
jgi:hypothetical protein